MSGTLVDAAPRRHTAYKLADEAGALELLHGPFGKCVDFENIGRLSPALPALRSHIQDNTPSTQFVPGTTPCAAVRRDAARHARAPKGGRAGDRE
eukprot:3475070-Rhodomonas_salina.1